MSNKTSDNVANIERLNNFANMTFLYGNRVNLNVSALKEIQNDIKNILSDYTRQKQINEEHQKENGLLREKVKELDTKNDELLKDLYSANCIISDLTDSIPKQTVIDKIKELEKLVFEIQESETCEEYPCGEDIIYRTQIDILQELLERRK